MRSTLASARNIPNAISAARLLATPVLCVALVRHDRPLFTWLLLACLLSDIADGLIARLFNLRSKLGALLDSTADLVVMLLGASGVWIFERAFLREHGMPIVVLLSLYVAEVWIAVLRYGRPSSFHTVLARVAAYAQGAFVMSLLFWGYQPALFVVMIALSTASLVEEHILLWIVPSWTADVRGLYWVLSRS